ncbi:hypothetical protein Pmani_020332 [Petrolisthes manimaculis]|uniref:Uncharacterized protein n=1 Tax=Petrolisthes manimaculis TaxID=1843537 RepID=A0AAE1U6H4_9EUCA|nr:hypothetical protein Pmani_020332 [Petrolisthes manimaculis]
MSPVAIKEAYCDTCYPIPSSAIVEALQAVMEANNNNNTHQHKPSSVTGVLNQARQDLDTLRKKGETTTRNYWNVLHSIVKMFTTNLCAREFLQCIKLAWKTIMAIRVRTTTNIKFFKICLADDALLCLARLDVKVTGLWQDAISYVIDLVRVSDGADNPAFSFFASYDVKRWILSVFCDAEALELSLVLLGHLIISCDSADTFSSRGLSRVGAVSFIRVCVNVLEVIPSLWFHHANSCNIMLTSISEMMETLTSLPKPQPLVQVLRRDHSQGMDKIRRLASDLGFQMPVLTSDDDHIITQCPERCPFTRATLDQHSFCRLPELQQEIHDWKTEASTTSSTSQHHNP